MNYKRLQEDANRKSVNSIGNQGPRYSGANLSSPESAYSTGYSTDGTSPGAPPEYFMNIKTGTEFLDNLVIKFCSIEFYRPTKYSSEYNVISVLHHPRNE